ncbi:MAG: MBOAT family protein [Clostridia bacterium]|nr:MBOAT family protein [Clostridia bacterium]
MLFSSSTFLFVFLPLVIMFYYSFFRHSRRLQNIFLLLASLIFYAWGEPSFVFVMLGSIIVNYSFGLLVEYFRQDKKKSKIILSVSVVFNLILLFIFKYLTFTIENINSIFGLSLDIGFNITLPLGISFFTFQAMSYVIDVYRGNEVQKNPLNVGLYIAFFPQLIAGPIVRYETVAYQINHRKENFTMFSDGVTRFIAGLGKKVLIANTMAIVADNTFNSDISELSVAFAWLGAIAYTFQIFFDFSGYSDMAIGLGKMFGFEFSENFDYPYISTSITEFWRRWHISLGTWFRDYVYFPLGGSRVKGKFRLMRNLFVVWFLTGVWHGANWTFILWGLTYFLLLVFEKITQIYKSRKFLPLKYLYTIFFVIMGWVLFRSDTVTQAYEYITAMFGGSGVLIDNHALFFLKENWIFFLSAVLCSTPLIRKILTKAENKGITSFFVMLFFLAILWCSVSYIVKGTYNPFIYFNF